MRFSSSGKYFTVKTTSPKQWFPAQILLNAMLSKNDPKRWKIIKLYSFYSYSYFPLSIFLVYNTFEEKILKRMLLMLSGTRSCLLGIPSPILLSNRNSVFFRAVPCTDKDRMKWERVGLLKGLRRGWLSLGSHTFALLLVLMPEKYMMAAILNHKANLKMKITYYE